MVANTELNLILENLLTATTPEHVFGGPDDLQLRAIWGDKTAMQHAVRSTFRRIAKIIHPDKFSGDADLEARATRAASILNTMFARAELKLKAGTYGEAEVDPVYLKTRKETYAVFESFSSGALCTNYRAIRQSDKLACWLSVSRNPVDNDLVITEGRLLKRLQQPAVDPLPFVPTLLDSFAYREEGSGINRQVNVFANPLNSVMPAWYTLEQVHAAYPHGLDPKDVAWIFRRLLIALDHAHSQQVLHGAVLPPYILIHPEMHGVLLFDWYYGLQLGTDERLKALPATPAYQSWYLPELIDGKPPLAGHDLRQAALSMEYLCFLGSTPPAIRAFFRGCAVGTLRSLPQSAARLLAEFDSLIEQLWGPRHFHVFTMPEH